MTQKEFNEEIEHLQSKYAMNEALSKKEFNLSEKEIDLPKEIVVDTNEREIHFGCGTKVYNKDDIKEAVRLLKEAFASGDENYLLTPIEKINKIFGDKLI